MSAFVDSEQSSPVLSCDSESSTPWIDADLYWEAREASCNRHRFYRITLSASLWSPWTVQRRWGRIGSQGRGCVVFCEGLEEALDITQEHIRRRGMRPIPYRLCWIKTFGTASVRDRLEALLSPELREDMALSRLAEQRDQGERRTVSHEEAWA